MYDFICKMSRTSFLLLLCLLMLIVMNALVVLYLKKYSFVGLPVHIIDDVEVKYVKSIYNASAASAMELSQPKSVKQPSQPTSSALEASNTSTAQAPVQSQPIQRVPVKFQENIGYVLATHYVDQLSGATINLFSLQCWASTLPGKIRVVEPFLHYGSMLGVELGANTSDENSPEKENFIKLFDMYDEQNWKSQTRNRGFRPIVSWKHFLQYSPRQLILVDKVCSDNSQCMACKESGFFESPHFAESAQKFASTYMFSIVRKVCYESRPYSKDEFYYTIYGNFTPSKVVVLFNHFGGIEPDGNALRFQVDLNNCYRPDFFDQVNFLIHKDIYRQSSQYVAAYMPNITSNGYISVMLRTEQLARGKKFQNMSLDDQMSQMKSCISKIVQTVQELSHTVNTTDLFLSTDTGKYGSAYFRHIKASHYFHEGVLKKNLDNKLQENGTSYFFRKGVLEAGLKKLHHSLFGTIQNLDERVDSITTYRVPGYVALLQMTLAANGTCLVLAGGGLYQNNVAIMHTSHFFKGCSVQYVQC